MDAGLLKARRRIDPDDGVIVVVCHPDRVEAGYDVDGGGIDAQVDDQGRVRAGNRGSGEGSRSALPTRPRWRTDRRTGLESLRRTPLRKSRLPWRSLDERAAQPTLQTFRPAMLVNGPDAVCQRRDSDGYHEPMPERDASRTYPLTLGEEPEYCPACGKAVTERVLEEDHRPRLVCPDGHVTWRNPRLVVGTLPVRDGLVYLARRGIEPASVCGATRVATSSSASPRRKARGGRPRRKPG